MRFEQSNISAISNSIANQVIELIVRAESAATHAAMSMYALCDGVSIGSDRMLGSLRHWPANLWKAVSLVPVSRVPAVVCFVTKQRQRQHLTTTRCRTLA